MTNEKMEQRLASALEKTAPDDVSGVLSRCEVRKGTVSSMRRRALPAGKCGRIRGVPGCKSQH